MNTYPLTVLWLQILALVAVEVGIVALCFAVVQRWCRRAVWRKMFCQAALISSLVLLVSELSGAGRTVLGRILKPRTISVENQKAAGHSSGVANQFRFTIQLPSESTNPPIEQAAQNLEPQKIEAPLAAEVAYSAPQSSVTNYHSLVTNRQSRLTDSSAIRLLGMILAAGAVFVAGRACLGRLLLVLLGSRRKAVRDVELLRQVESIARNLKISRRIRIIESPRLLSPIVFGLMRPTIGLPLSFCRRFSSAKQEAMLTHELAHLAAHDPFWYFLADLIAAFFWWHPGVWWLRRQLQLSSELTADEASLMSVDGPRVLAECLVEMGAQLAKPGYGQLRVAGFRSDLGCRVQRLMGLKRVQWTPISNRRAILAGSIAPIALAGTIIFCTAWAVPQELTKGDSMKTMKKNWQGILASFATVVAIQTPNLVVAQGDPPPAIPSAGTAVNALPLAERPIPPAAPAGGNYFGRAGEPRFGGRAGALAGMIPPSHDGPLERKLREIVLDEVKFDGLPLSEVLNFLGEASQKHDPEKKGINFLIDPNPPQIGPSTAPATIDPATGLPLTASVVEQIDMGSVSVRFNMALRHVTMADVLDAIVRVADHPIQYSVEDYAVIFSLKPEANMGLSMAARAPGPAPLAVRTFHVDTNTFVGGLESAFGIKIDGKGKGDSQSKKIQSALKELLTQLNVNMDGNKAIFYNELTGTVMVRIAVEDIDVIQAAIETLGGQPMGGGYAMGYPGLVPPAGMRR